jgi:hypothetical protein
MEQYFDNRMYYMRGECDRELPAKLKGREREIAKQMIEKNVYGDEEDILHLIAAAKKLDMNEMLPKVKALYAQTKKPHMKMYLCGLLLKQWACPIPYDEFHGTLLKVKDVEGGYHKQTALWWTADLKKEDALTFCLALVKDSDSHVRYLALKKLQELTGRIDSKIAVCDYSATHEAWHENKYYTAEEVYGNSALFEDRYQELAEKVRSGRWNVPIDDEIMKSGIRIIKDPATIIGRLKVVAYKNGAWIRLFQDPATNEYWEDFNVTKTGVVSSYLKEVTTDELKKYYYKYTDNEGEHTRDRRP